MKAVQDGHGEVLASENVDEAISALGLAVLGRRTEAVRGGARGPRWAFGFAAAVGIVADGKRADGRVSRYRFGCFLFSGGGACIDAWSW